MDIDKKMKEFDEKFPRINGDWVYHAPFACEIKSFLKIALEEQKREHKEYVASRIKSDKDTAQVNDEYINHLKAQALASKMVGIDVEGLLREFRERLLKYKGVWFCTCKEQNHTVGCTRTTNRKIDDISKEIESFLKEKLGGVDITEILEVYEKVQPDQEFTMFVSCEEVWNTIKTVAERYKK